jgi:hypothetical protein
MIAHRSFAARGSVAAVALAAILAGCGIGAQSSPSKLSGGKVPFDPQETPASTTTIPVARSDRRLSVFLVSGDGTRLVEVERDLAKDLSPSAERSLVSLLSPLSDAERAKGYQTFVPESTVLRSIAVVNNAATTSTLSAGSTVIVDLNDKFTEVPLGSQKLAVAQIVFTATRYYSVDYVVFSVNGKALKVPNEQGLTDQPLSRESFPALSQTLIQT